MYQLIGQLIIMLEKQHMETIINFCGWLYFIIWSVSFYPQVFLLFKQKSYLSLSTRAMGISSNYIFINLTGYAMYTVYNCYGFIKGDNQQTGNVDQTDILFSLHALVVYALTVTLYFYYPHNLDLNLVTKLYLLIQWTVFLYFGLYAINAEQSLTLSFLGFETNLGYFETLGYFKMFSTFLKHPTQIYFNFKRQSTKGWSIEGMILDFLGGFFSLIALLLQLYINPKLHINTAKLFLSVMSMIYDSTYMVQHFILYGDREVQTPQPTKERLSPRPSTSTVKKDQEELKNLIKQSVSKN